MTTDQVAVLAITTGAVVAVVLVVALVVLGRRVRDLGHLVEELRRETVPLVRDARVVVDQAATEMVRVGDVLESAEAVSATVDSASRLAYRAFSNPVVKVLAYATGASSAVRRFFDRRAARPTASARPPTRTHLAPLARGAPAPLPGASPSSPAPRRARARGGRHVGVPAAAAGGSAAVIRRPLWLMAGAALGAGGTLWTRRRVQRLSRRLSEGTRRAEVASLVDRRARSAADRVRDAMAVGRSDAQRREDDLWRVVATRDAAAPAARPGERWR